MREGALRRSSGNVCESSENSPEKGENSDNGAMDEISAENGGKVEGKWRITGRMHSEKVLSTGKCGKNPKIAAGSTVRWKRFDRRICVRFFVEMEGKEHEIFG